MSAAQREEVVQLEPLAVRRSTAAKMLDCGLTTVHRMVRDGRLRTISIGGGDLRITVKSIRALLE